VIKTDKVSCLL